MKKSVIPALFLSASLIVSCQKQAGETNAATIMKQQKPPIEEELLVTDAEMPAEAYVCTLTSTELAERKALLQKLIVPEISGVEELSNGYRLNFPAEDDVTENVVRFMLLEKQCCAFFAFELSISAFNGGIALAITGNRLTKQFIGHQLRDMGIPL